jgi:microcystin degradation protein MlrC
MRVAVAGFAHESNTFSSQPTTLDDFEIEIGQQLLDDNAVAEVHAELEHRTGTRVRVLFMGVTEEMEKE